MFILAKLIYRYKRNKICIHNYVCNKDIERKTAVFYQAHIELLQNTYILITLG